MKMVLKKRKSDVNKHGFVEEDTKSNGDQESVAAQTTDSMECEDESDGNSDESINDGNDDDETSKPRTASESSDVKTGAKKKRGIIYISSIPKYMNVTILREMLSQYAKLNRIFLQPRNQDGKFELFR